MITFKILRLWIIFLLSLIFNVNTKDLNNIKNSNYNSNEKLVYNIISNNTVSIVGVSHIDNYEDYLNYTYPLIKEYDEEFFHTHSLIIYGTWEPSGSNIVEITSLELDNEDNLILKVFKKIPNNGTCDMRYHGFIIEYQKLEKPINKIIITTTVNKMVMKEFVLKDEKSKTDIEKFLKNINDNYKQVEAFIWFTHEDINHLSPDAKKAYFEKKVVKYKINQLNGQLRISDYSPTVFIKFNAFDDNELNKLYNISQIEDIGKVYFWIYFENINITHKVIKNPKYMRLVLIFLNQNPYTYNQVFFLLNFHKNTYIYFQLVSITLMNVYFVS